MRSTSTKSWTRVRTFILTCIESKIERLKDLVKQLHKPHKETSDNLHKRRYHSSCAGVNCSKARGRRDETGSSVDSGIRSHTSKSKNSILLIHFSKEVLLDFDYNYLEISINLHNKGNKSKSKGRFIQKNKQNSKWFLHYLQGFVFLTFKFRRIV